MAGTFLGGLVPVPDLPSAGDLLGQNPLGGALNGLFPDDSMLGQLFNRPGPGQNSTSSVTKLWSNFGTFGYVPNNRFRMEFTPPKVLQEQLDNERLSVACEELTLPGKSLGTTDYTLQGPGRQMPYEFIFSQSIEMSFRLSDNMYERKIWLDWMDGVISPESGVMSYYEDYTSTVDLVLVDDSDADVYKWTVNEIYPKAIGAIQVAQSNEGYAVQPITFNFRDFTTELLQQDLASGISDPGQFSMPEAAQNGGLLGEINEMTGGLSGAVINNYGTMLNDLF
jgi:hypothetical protein